MITSRGLTVTACVLLFTLMPWSQAQAAAAAETPQQRVADLKAWLHRRF